MIKQSLSEVLEVLESGQEIELPMDPKYYQKLHSRIMKAVDRIEATAPEWFEKPTASASFKEAPGWRGETAKRL